MGKNEPKGSCLLCQTLWTLTPWAQLTLALHMISQGLLSFFSSVFKGSAGEGVG